MNPQKDRVTAAILGILLGSLGIHKFYLGDTQKGIIYLLLGCVGVGGVLGLVDGIIYLTKTDEDFQANYMNWFCGPSPGSTGGDDYGTPPSS